MIIISQYIWLSNHYVVLLKFIQVCPLYLNKAEREKERKEERRTKERRGQLPYLIRQSE
jgi:hypothetical protein